MYTLRCKLDDHTVYLLDVARNVCRAAGGWEYIPTNQDVISWLLRIVPLESMMQEIALGLLDARDEEQEKVAEILGKPCARRNLGGRPTTLRQLLSPLTEVGNGPIDQITARNQVRAAIAPPAHESGILPGNPNQTEQAPRESFQPLAGSDGETGLAVSAVDAKPSSPKKRRHKRTVL